MTDWQKRITSRSLLPLRLKFEPPLAWRPHGQSRETVLEHLFKPQEFMVLCVTLG